MYIYIYRTLSEAHSCQPTIIICSAALPNGISFSFDLWLVIFRPDMAKYYTILYYTILYYTVLYYTILYYNVYAHG